MARRLRHTPPTSWQQTKRTAETWVNSLQLGNVKGEYLDLHTRAEGLPEIPEFRQMVLEAAKRILISRGAKSVWLPD